jgi:hypothetical protein
MGLGDDLKSLGKGISNGVDAAEDGAHRAADWTEKEAKKGYEAARSGVVRGKLWVSDEVKNVEDFLGQYPENEKFPDTINYDVFQRAGPPMPAAGAWAAPGGPSTLSPAERSFIYLDVGRWGGSRFWPTARDFGIVCGRTAVLCAFKTPVGKAEPLPNKYSRPEVDHINALLTHLGTGALGPVKVRRFDTARTLLPDNADVTPDRIFVIVGDMHLPVITSLNDTFGARFGRQPGNDGEGGDMVINDAIDWYSKYAGDNGSGTVDHKGADIFEQAGPDLTEFVRLLNAFSAFPLHLLQLGDMIDMWIGLERFFVADPSSVVLDYGKKDPDPPTWINHWTDKTLNGTTQSEHVRRFLGFSNGRKNWLYGNHDNYLAKHNPTDLVTASGGLNRQETFDDRQTRLFASHGHKWDSNNRDGATFGQKVTQAAFSVPQVRMVEPGGRRACLIGAADMFLARETNPFCVWVMGHTHVGVLSRIVILNHT